jgi:hypothetical protein
MNLIDCTQLCRIGLRVDAFNDEFGLQAFRIPRKMHISKVKFAKVNAFGKLFVITLHDHWEWLAGACAEEQQ